MPGFRWILPLSRGHNEEFSPPAGVRKGKGQGGFLIILVLHYNTLEYVYNAGIHLRV
jgi:hypothetical protein